MSSKRILVIYPEVENLRRYKMMVERHCGYDVDIAITGEEGVKLAERHQPDLIFVDTFLHPMRWPELLERIQSSEKLDNVPVVLSVATHLLREYIALPPEPIADYYIQRPPDWDDFQRSFTKIFGPD